VVTEASRSPERIDHTIRVIEGRWGLVCVLVLFVVLGAVYSLATPVFEAPDEPWHFLYAKRLADGDGLPPLTFSSDPWVQGEAHQPPLYYALAAATISWVDTTDWQQTMQRNPHAAPGAPHSFGNKNIVLHQAGAGDEWTGTRLAVHVVRFLSIAMGALTVWVTYQLVRELRPEMPWMAPVAAAIVAFNPQFLFISAAVSNDNLITLLCSMALLLILRGMRGRMSAWWYAKLGLVIGAAILSKLAGLGLLIPALLSIAWVAARDRNWRTFAGPAAVILLVALGVGGWWYVRNLVVYQDALGMRAMTTAFRTHDRVPTLVELLRTTGNAEISFWGVFGWMNVLAGEWYYLAVRAVGRIAAVGLGLVLIRRYRRGRPVGERSARLAILALWALVVLSTLVNWSREVTGPQGRLMFPAISVGATFLTMGLSALSPVGNRRVVPVGAAVFLLAAALVMPFAYIAPAYARPPVVTADQVPKDAKGLNITYENGIQLAAYRVDQQSVAPGDALDVYLYWQALKPIKADYSAFVHLFGRDRQWLGQTDTYPGRGNFPTSSWMPGELICDHYRVSVAEDAVVPAAGRVEVGLYQLPGYETVPAKDAQGRDIGGSPRIGVLRIGAATLPAYEPVSATSVAFGDKVELRGYDLSRDRLDPDDELSVTLYWLVTADLERDYTVFVHLTGPEGMGGQADGQPLQGEYPTSLWVPGETVMDNHVLEVWSDAAPGEYRVEVGLYLLGSGVRLPASGDGARGQDYAILGPVEVIGP
jgi:4-amino-4-deoxy-L-arabinose transferase-like glycosyltransferase